MTFHSPRKSQDGLSASLLEQDLEEPLPLTHIKMAYAEWRANDVCLEDLLGGTARETPEVRVMR